MGLLAIQRPEAEAGKAWPAIVIGLFVAFGGVLFGYDFTQGGKPQATVRNADIII
jgi:hypothetical protein